MTPFTTPERHFELLKDGEGERALVIVRFPTGNGAFETVGTWHPINGLDVQAQFVPGVDMLKLVALCAHEFVKG